MYPRDVWAGEVQTRRKTVGGESFEERLLPVASAEDYFQHFGTLEVDATYYRPLLEETGKPSANLFTLEHYADAAPANARFVLKAPQQFLARRLRRKVDGRWAYVDNPDLFDADAFTQRFLRPAQDKLGVKLAGVILEQPYERAADSPPSEAFVSQWAEFLEAVPPAPYHVEVRSSHQLTARYFEWLSNAEVGLCFSHWQWLPPIIDQWRMAGERFSAAGRTAVVRLTQPRDMSFEPVVAAGVPVRGGGAGPERHARRPAHGRRDDGADAPGRRGGRDAGRDRQQPRVGQHARPGADAGAPVPRLRRASRRLTTPRWRRVPPVRAASASAGHRGPLRRSRRGTPASVPGL